MKVRFSLGSKMMIVLKLRENTNDLRSRYVCFDLLTPLVFEILKNHSPIIARV